MKAQNNIYRTNFSLITAFLVLITVTLIIAIFVSYKLTSKYVENEFASKKIEVLDQTIKPYNDFFFHQDPRNYFLPGLFRFGIGSKLFGNCF
jgi:two-component system phosphate regulon sensor histidine kinase PhoR